MRSISLIVLAALLTACGQKGPLYLPGNDPEPLLRPDERHRPLPAANPEPGA